MKKLIIIFQLLFLVLLVYSQNLNTDPDIHMGDLSQYGQNGNMVNLGIAGQSYVEIYTGRPTFSKTLFTLKEGDLNLPIAISYISAGVKVNDVAD